MNRQIILQVKLKFKQKKIKKPAKQLQLFMS